MKNGCPPSDPRGHDDEDLAVLDALEMALWGRDRDGVSLADRMVSTTTPSCIKTSSLRPGCAAWAYVIDATAARLPTSHAMFLACDTREVGDEP
jgi:hypothetical protein